MSQTKTLVVATTVTRTKTDKTGGQGCGNSTRLRAGRFNESTDHIYRSLLRPILDWTEVGQIVSATLVVYTASAGLTGRAYLRRLTSAFVDGNNADGTFDSSDYTNPTETTSGAQTITMPTALGGEKRINITGWFNALAPKTVKQSNGKAGTASPNYGWALDGYGSTFGARWIGYSNDQEDVGVLPHVELVYEPAKTLPNVPTNLTPAGAVTSVDFFEGDFSDTKGSDTLAYSAVQIYDAGHSGTAATNDYITDTAHGLHEHDAIYMTSLTGGVGLAMFTRYYVRVPTANTFKVSLTDGGTVVNITDNYSALTWSTLIWASGWQRESATAISNGRSQLDPVGMPRLTTGINYRWRLSHKDQEDQSSPWTTLVTFSVSNNNPDAPTLTPTGVSLDTLNAIIFRGGEFSDPDAGDVLQSFQIQLSAFADFDVSDPNNVLWDTGRVVTPFNATSWGQQYGGPSLVADTYYLRARQWDQRNGVSDWSTTATIILTVDFDEQPGNQTLIRLNKRAPWRLVIKAMHTNGQRGPGKTVGILTDAKSIGASKMFNSPGELHFTLPVDHPQISVVEPKQVHYSLQIRDGEGWREKFAGLVWDMDATETSVIFYGLDYLALFDYDYDERFSGDPDLDYTKGGSKYTNKTIRDIVIDQLTQALAVTNSPVRFITLGTIATMSEKTTIYSTYEPRLRFITGMLNSHRQGTGKQTQIKVRQKTGGGYEVVVVEIDLERAPKEHLRLRYGELVNGYRIIPFGTSWASRTAGIGRTRSGLKVLYKVASAPGIDQSIWGRITQTRVFDSVADENDLIRQLKQAALHSGKLGSQVALGIRSGVISPFDGYDLCDAVPVKINHGAVNTDNYGSGYWVIFGVAWEVGDDGSSNTILTLQPREDLTEPDPDLIPTRPLSTQAEWQVGWQAPDPVTGIKTGSSLPLSLDTGFFMDDDLTMDSAYGFKHGGNIYYDASTGKSYELMDDGTWALVGGPSTLLRPSQMLVTAIPTLNADGTAVINLSMETTP